MNVFDDLLEELREENLIEKSKEKPKQESNLTSLASEIDKHDEKSPSPLVQRADIAAENPPQPEEPESGEFSDLGSNLNHFFDEPIKPATTTSHNQPFYDETDEPRQPIALSKEKDEQPDPQFFESAETEGIETSEAQSFAAKDTDDVVGVASTENLETESAKGESVEATYDDAINLASEPKGSDFFLRRANEEVTSLQIVEHIITAIEREQIKAISKPYDDLPVKMALHDFQKAVADLNSEEHAQAEFKLMQETGSWYTALSLRDKQILVGDLRRYCENAKPALSPHALIALARFYRNSAFTETVRSKFDMVITRLFTKELWDDSREFLFNRSELVGQINNLYAEWSSIPLYETDEDDSDVLIGVLKFEDFIFEVTNADSIEDLIKNDFFNRVKIYKENTGEKFFAPLLLATIIESNVVVGNKFVELIRKERELRKEEELSEKYQQVLDASVSDATSKTLQLIEVLKEKKEPEKAPENVPAAEIKESFNFEKVAKPKYRAADPKQSRFKVNKWLLAFAFVVLAGLGGVYVWVEYFTPPMKSSASVKKVSLENSALKEFFSSARINGNRMYLIALPNWDGLSNDVKEDLLKKTLTVGGEKGYNKIVVLNKEGKTVSIASAEGIKPSL